MTRFVIAAVFFGVVASASAQPTTSPTAQPAPAAPAPAVPAPSAAPRPVAKPGATVLPAVGDFLIVDGLAPKLEWLYDFPSATDAAGKVVVHWFCAPKAPSCTEDLARVVTLKEQGKVYVIAYISGTKAQAKKLDPIRESEGVGRGTVAFGKNVTKLMKDIGVTGPASVVVGVDGHVLLVSTGSSPTELDARDAKVAATIATIKDYVATSEGPQIVKPGDKFPLSMSIKLASWLKYSDKTPMELKVTVPPDIKCDATTLKTEQIKVVERTLTATVNCSGPRGIYEARGDLRFGYDTPGGTGTGIGAESAKWKFEIKN